MSDRQSYNFSGQDLNKRLSRGRRLPRPSSTTTTSHVLVNPDDPLANPPLTYSNFLGMLQIDNPLSNGRHFNSEPHSSTGSTHSPNYSHAGPSRTQTHSYYRLPTALFTVDPGWVNDSLGNPLDIGNGRMIEVTEDEIQSTTNMTDEEGEISITPRAKRPALAAYNAAEQHTRTYVPQGIPFHATPSPPGPRSEYFPSVKESLDASNASDDPSFKATTAATAATIPMFNSLSVQSIPDGPVEVALVKESLALLGSTQNDVQFMSTYFLAHIGEHDLSDHVDTCGRIEEAIKSLRKTLILRTQIGAEEWGVRSSSWHQKYARRLLSLRITLQRLSRVKTLLENRPLSPQQSATILTKLEQHEAKLADLASKYSVAFDRLRLRHLHFLLTQSHNEARDQQKTRLSSRASFERRWNDGKAFRSGLRNAFHELRQEFYDNRTHRAKGKRDAL